MSPAQVALRTLGRALSAGLLGASLYFCAKAMLEALLAHHLEAHPHDCYLIRAAALCLATLAFVLLTRQS